MARGTGGAPIYAAWLAHAGRLIASNQRLLGYPIAIRAISAGLFVLVAVASRPDLGFTRYARDAVAPDDRLVDLLSVPLPGSWLAAIVAYFIGSVLAEAALAGTFIAAVRDGRADWRIGWPAYANLVLFYAVTNAIGLGLVAYAGSHYADVLALLVLLIVTAWPTVYADYAIVLERRSVIAGAIRSFRVASVRWRETLTLLVAVNLIGVLAGGTLTQQLLDANGVFPPFFLAVLLVDGMIRYCGDCAGIAVLLEAAPSTAPTPPADAGPAGG